MKTSLDSLFSDGYPNLELVLLDDGSSDATFEIAQHWVSLNGVRLAGGAQLSRQDNRGRAATLNTLLRCARGDYFALLASDDLLLPGGIAARVAYLEARPDYLAVCGDACGIDENGLPLAHSMLDRSRVFRSALRCDFTRPLEIISKWAMPGPVYLARRTVTEKIGWYDERFRYEDRNYYLRLIAARALGYVDAQVASYRVSRRPEENRYRVLDEDRRQIEQELVSRFKGLERFAMEVVALRHRRPPSFKTNMLIRFWYRIPDWALRRLRRINRMLAVLAELWLLGTDDAPESRGSSPRRGSQPKA